MTDPTRLISQARALQFAILERAQQAALGTPACHRTMRVWRRAHLRYVRRDLALTTNARHRAVAVWMLEMIEKAEKLNKKAKKQ